MFHSSDRVEIDMDPLLITFQFRIEPESTSYQQINFIKQNKASLSSVVKFLNEIHNIFVGQKQKISTCIPVTAVARKTTIRHKVVFTVAMVYFVWERKYRVMKTTVNVFKTKLPQITIFS